MHVEESIPRRQLIIQVSTKHWAWHQPKMVLVCFRYPRMSVFFYSGVKPTLWWESSVFCTHQNEESTHFGVKSHSSGSKCMFAVCRGLFFSNHMNPGVRMDGWIRSNLPGIDSCGVISRLYNLHHPARRVALPGSLPPCLPACQRVETNANECLCLFRKMLSK